MQQSNPPDPTPPNQVARKISQEQREAMIEEQPVRLQQLNLGDREAEGEGAEMKQERRQSKEAKEKKRKVKAYITNFEEYIPESLLVVNKAVIPPKIRVGQKYQASVPVQPPYESSRRSVREWLAWEGSGDQQGLTQDHVNRFKELLGENRNEQELIQMRVRLGNPPWNEVLDYVRKSRAELRRAYHNVQRGRQ